MLPFKPWGDEDSRPANPQYNFLLKAVLEVTAIELIRDSSVLVYVAGNIRVQKQYRDLTSGGAVDPVQPCLNLDIPILYGYQGFYRKQFHVGDHHGH